MHDIKWIRENAIAFDKGLNHRGLPPLSVEILKLDEEHRAVLHKLQVLQAKKNDIASKIGLAKKTGESSDQWIQEGALVKEELPQLEGRARDLQEQLHVLLISTPNLPLQDVPKGQDDEDNLIVRTVGEIPSFSFTPKQHFELGEALGLMDFEQAAYMTGSRFVILKGALARLERALGQFMLDIHTKEFGYTEVSAPLLVNDRTMFGTGQLPKFAEDSFRTTNNYWLIPTSEVSLTSLVAGKTLDIVDLPLRYTAFTPCFRSEAGSAGRDTRGMLRQHQFYKVELVSIALPNEAEEELERMTRAAEEILKRLGLAYRVASLCVLGFNSQKTYDLEVWLPGQNTYREISSCSLCGDFQARRMNARFKCTVSDKKPQFVYTLNGSGLAVGRALIAILENYQRQDGSIEIPSALIPYMDGLKEIKNP